MRNATRVMGEDDRDFVGIETTQNAVVAPGTRGDDQTCGKHRTLTDDKHEHYRHANP